MGVGGTNWGNLGYPEGYTSYDYGAPITELRTVERENYSELKLQAGGSAFGHSVWLNETFVGSFSGAITAYTWNQTFALPTQKG